jgi:hypothetical protein
MSGDRSISPPTFVSISAPETRKVANDLHNRADVSIAIGATITLDSPLMVKDFDQVSRPPNVANSSDHPTQKRDPAVTLDSPEIAGIRTFSHAIARLRNQTQSTVTRWTGSFGKLIARGHIHGRGLAGSKHRGSRICDRRLGLMLT